MSSHESCSRAKLLVAIDDSIPAQWAVHIAKGFAKRMDAEIVLLNVIPSAEPVGPEAVFAGTTLDVREQIKRESTELLRKMRQDLPTDMSVQMMTREGDPSEQVIALASELNANLIVLGSRGHNRFAHFVLGSTAEGVIRGAKCPVLTISHEPTCCGSKSK